MIKKTFTIALMFGYCILTNAQQTLQKNLKMYLPMNNSNFTDWGPYNIQGSNSNISLSTDNRNISNFAYEFNGSNSRMTWASDDSLKIQFPITISVWVYLDDSSKNNPIFTSDASNTNYSGYWLACNQGKIHFGYGNDQGAGTQFRRSFESGLIVPSKKWFHITATLKSLNSASIYFNHNLVSLTTSGSNINRPIYSNANGHIGYVRNYFGTPDFYLKGKLAGLGIWNRELNELERKQAAHLTLWYEIDNGTDDQTRYLNDGVETKVTFVNDRTNQQNGAVKLNANGSRVQLPANNSYKKGLPITISLWVKPDSVLPFAHIINLSNITNGRYNGISLDINDGVFNATMGTNLGAGVAHRRTFKTNDTLINNSWYHVVCEFYRNNNIDSTKIWINGKLSQGFYDGSGTSTNFESNQNGYIGFQTNPFGNDKEFYGSVDQIQIYDAQIGNLLRISQWTPSLYIEKILSNNEVEIGSNFTLNSLAIGSGKVTYQWQKKISGNWTNITGNKNLLNFSNFSLNDTGIYRCKINCYSLELISNEVKLKEKLNTSTFDLISSDLNLYPNPVNDKIFINSIPENTKVEIYDLNGKLLLVENFKNFIDVSSLQFGVYHCKINFEDSIKFIKFIKN